MKDPNVPAGSTSQQTSRDLVEVPGHVVGVFLVGLSLLGFLAYQSLLGTETSPPRQDMASQQPAPAVESAPAELPPTDAVLRDTTSVKEIQELRGLPQAKLEQLVREGTPILRTSSLSVLWARGQRETARQLARGDTLLEAQLQALERRAP